MKGACEEDVGPGGRVNRVCGVCRLIFYALLCRDWLKIRAANRSFLRGSALCPGPPVESACKSPPKRVNSSLICHRGS